MYSIFPSPLQVGLLPIALVGKSLCDYSLMSRRRVARLAMFRSDSDDTIVAKDEVAVLNSSPAEDTEVSGICWKFARHGKILLPEVFHGICG